MREIQIHLKTIFYNERWHVDFAYANMFAHLASPEKNEGLLKVLTDLNVV